MYNLSMCKSLLLFVFTALPASFSFAMSSENRLVEETFQVRSNQGKNFTRMLLLHSRLLQGSPTYKDVVCKIKSRGEAVTLLDQDEAISRLKAMKRPKEMKEMLGFQHRAQFNSRLNAVVVKDPERLDDATLGKLIAFEMINGFHNPRFTEEELRAYNGDYDDCAAQGRIERGAERFMHAMEKIEHDGLALHDKVMTEAMEVGTVDEGWHWNNCENIPTHKRIIHHLILTEDGQKHMDYWRNFYTDDIFPELQKKRQSGVTERMKRLGVAVMIR
jgi:hypothetical protein